MTDTRANRGLVTQSLVRNAGAALDGSATLSLTSLMDLCTLCEALVLLDDVQSLEAVNRHSSPLTDRLEQEGLYGTLRPSLTGSDLRRLFLRMPAELAARTILPDGRDPTPRIDDDPLAGGGDPPASLDDLVAQVDRLVAYPSAGTVASERAYRSNGYLIVAAAHGLDYFPDCERGIFTAGCLQKVYRSLPMRLYEKVAESLDDSLTGGDLVAEWAAISTIPIPPVSALVLDLAATPAELPVALLRVREDFARYRRYFADFKAELEKADTIKERTKLRNRYQVLLNEASGPNAEIVSLASMLNLTQSVVSAAAAPTAVTGYGALLLTQPIDWIQRWWRRRPLSILLRMDSKLPRLSVYRGLVGKLWGEQAAELVLNEFAARAQRQRSLLADAG
ncbi:hypothetical protein ND748_18355 [Frankia sp. AiPs1]|uniref:hypothetical protein n=1 Tax=Frankia sp. AiPs1 TaxID=573493 RepID=UPI002043DB7C|nr:hypothetical protein [Frankia sp. AiPs1]MCM3923619.1 hypothetical protein [Frankia sp. AiPs1]